MCDFLHYRNKDLVTLVQEWVNCALIRSKMQVLSTKNNDFLYIFRAIDDMKVYVKDSPDTDEAQLCLIT